MAATFTFPDCLMSVEVAIRCSSCSMTAVSVLSKPQHVFKPECDCETLASR